MYNVNILTEFRNRRLDLELQNDLDDIDTKMRIFSKNHKHRKQMVRRDLRRMVESGRKMSLSDLQEFDRRKNLKLAADLYSLEKDEDKSSSEYDGSRRNSDESCRLPDVLGRVGLTDTVPLPQTVSLPQIDMISRSTTPAIEPIILAPNSKWRLLSRVILNTTPETEKTESAELAQTNRRPSDPRIQESRTDYENKFSDLPPIYGKVTSMNREMEPMREEDSESCCARMSPNNTSFTRRNSMVTTSLDFKPNADSAYLNRKRFSISVSELPLLNRRGSVCPSEANSKLSFQPSIYGNKFNRRSSCSFSRIETSSDFGSEKDNMANRWKRLKAVSLKNRERKGDSSCRKLASMTVDSVVKSFITSLQETSQKAKEKKAVKDLYYLRKCRYLRHPSCLF